jgi:predicted nucleic acid-binding Zn ribbon protein
VGEGRTEEPEDLGVVLAALSGGRVLAAGLSLGRLGREWPTVVGERLSEECEPASLERGVLVVRVSSAAWATHVRFLAEEIRTRANEALRGQPGDQAIREVRVVVGASAGPATRA